MFYWVMKNIIIGPLVKGIFRPWVTGAGNVPADGAVILASNHLSFVDSIFLPLVIERPMVFLAKSDYFTGKGLKGWLTKMFFLGTGQLPIDRSGGKASEACSIRDCKSSPTERSWVFTLKAHVVPMVSCIGDGQALPA